jgi:hypothetical protein
MSTRCTSLALLSKHTLFFISLPRVTDACSLPLRKDSGMAVAPLRSYEPIFRVRASLSCWRNMPAATQMVESRHDDGLPLHGEAAMRRVMQE